MGAKAASSTATQTSFFMFFSLEAARLLGEAVQRVLHLLLLRAVAHALHHLFSHGLLARAVLFFPLLLLLGSGLLRFLGDRRQLVLVGVDERVDVRRHLVAVAFVRKDR